MSEASANAVDARTRASVFGVLLLGWLAFGVVAGMTRLLNAPPAPVARFGAEARRPAPQEAPAAEESESYAPAQPEISIEDRIRALTRVEMLSADVAQGRPRYDTRTFPAYSDVGYYIELAEAQNDSLRVELLDGERVLDSCVHDQIYGSGSRYCQFPSMPPGNYEIRVQISGYQTGLLSFHVDDATSETLVTTTEDVPTPIIITNPRWIERPRASDFARLYPERAIRRGQEGRVVLSCLVGADGSVQCSVASENPPGWGFGEASIRLSRLFRMSPQLADGRPTEGGRVRVPVVWTLGD